MNVSLVEFIIYGKTNGINTYKLRKGKKKMQLKSFSESLFRVILLTYE